MNFTILGGGGFLGAHLVGYLKSQGHTVNVPRRNLDGIFDIDLGHVIYAIGLTGDFRSRPFDTVEAHVSLLSRLLQKCRFDSWLYLSSTRIYSELGLGKVATEKSDIVVNLGLDNLYNLSKLMGESLCLACPNSNIRVARLSNIYGAGMSPNTFLGSILKDLHRHGSVTLNECPNSGKDYIASSDVVSLLEKISSHGLQRIYNIASGISLSHRELFDAIFKLTGFSLNYSDACITRKFPLVDISLIQNEFGFQPKLLLDNIGELLYECGVNYDVRDNL